MDRIGNGVNHMRLDSDFLNTSKEWGQKFDRNALNREKTGKTTIEHGIHLFNVHQSRSMLTKVNDGAKVNL